VAAARPSAAATAATCNLSIHLPLCVKSSIEDAMTVPRIARASVR
jgi:hypothetical protein